MSRNRSLKGMRRKRSLVLENTRGNENEGRTRSCAPEKETAGNRLSRLPAAVSKPMRATRYSAFRIPISAFSSLPVDQRPGGGGGAAVITQREAAKFSSPAGVEDVNTDRVDGLIRQRHCALHFCVSPNVTRFGVIRGRPITGQAGRVEHDSYV